MSAEETLADASAETIDATAAAERVVASFASGAPPPLAALASAADLAGVPLPAIAACVLVVATVLFWLIARLAFGSRRSRGGSGDAVLLCGVCGAGKTSLFQTLRTGAPFLRTVTSMAPNDARFAVEGTSATRGVVSKHVRVVDLPGHPRLRAAFDEHAPRARAIVFLVDAVDFTARRREAAERLFEILSDPAVAKRRCPVLVACNKSEKITAHPVDVVRKRLEKEVDALRQSVKGQLADSAGGEAGAGNAARLGREGEPFRFDDATLANKIAFAACSVAENDLQDVKAFLVKA